MAGERVIGEVYHVQGKLGIGLIRLDRLKSATNEPTINESAVSIMSAPDGSES